jgi:hypothetical protein
MNKTILVFFLAFSSSFTFASAVPAVCFRNAEKFVESSVGDSYDKEGFDAYECKKSPVGNAVVCDVAASKGNGAAFDTYRVVLSPSCKRSYRIELIGEE